MGAENSIIRDENRPRFVRGFPRMVEDGPGLRSCSGHRSFEPELNSRLLGVLQKHGMRCAILFAALLEACDATAAVDGWVKISALLTVEEFDELAVLGADLEDLEHDGELEEEYLL